MTAALHGHLGFKQILQTPILNKSNIDTNIEELLWDRGDTDSLNHTRILVEILDVSGLSDGLRNEECFDCSYTTIKNLLQNNSAADFMAPSCTFSQICFIIVSIKNFDLAHLDWECHQRHCGQECLVYDCFQAPKNYRDIE